MECEYCGRESDEYVNLRENNCWGAGEYEQVCFPDPWNDDSILVYFHGSVNKAASNPATEQ